MTSVTSVRNVTLWSTFEEVVVMRLGGLREEIPRYTRWREV